MKLDWIIKEATAPCFVEELNEAECLDVICKVNETLTKEEMNLLCSMVSRATNLAWQDGHNC